MIDEDTILIQIASRSGSPSAAQHRRSMQRGRVIEHRTASGVTVAVRKRRNAPQDASRKGWQVYFPRA